MSEKLLRNPDVVMREEDDEALLYCAEDDDLGVGNVSFLNKTGKIIWQLCDGSCSGDEIVEIFFSKFTDTPKDELKTDIETFIDSLLKKRWLINV